MCNDSMAIMLSPDIYRKAYIHYRIGSVVCLCSRNLDFEAPQNVQMWESHKRDCARHTRRFGDTGTSLGAI